MIKIKKNKNIKSYAYIGTKLIKRFIRQVDMQYAILDSPQAVELELMSPCLTKEHKRLNCLQTANFVRGKSTC